jgi:hypothetical protein
MKSPSFTSRCILASLIAALLVPSVGAAPLISEFLASNITGLKDEDGDESDWIEIHNPDAQPVNLSGWGLTDLASLEEPWLFPAVTLAAGARLVVFASGKNRRHPAANLHTSFSLSAAGEFLALIDPSGTAVSSFSPQFPPQLPDVSYGSAGAMQTLVDGTSALSYHIPLGDIGTAWRGSAFTDPGSLFISQSGGQPLRPGIGYDTKGDYNPLISTFVPTGTTGVFTRIPFQVADASTLSGLTMEVQYDDAFVAWINGVEVARTAGAPAVPQWNSISSLNHTSALDSGEVFDLSSHLGQLQTGSNVLAIHILNRSSGSSDLVCKPRLTAAGQASGTGFLLSNTPGTSNAGSFTPGPAITSLTHTPLIPGNAQAIKVEAAVAPRFAAISSVTLFYRVNYEAELSLPMSTTGDGVYSANIPASASDPGEMVRWRVVVTDVSSNTWREPTFLDREGTNQSAEYRGTVISQLGIPGNLPVYHWFTLDVTNSRNRTGARASFFYEGAFHDNVFVRQRGGFTNTGSQKFDFNQNEAFEYNPAVPKVGEVNLNAQGNDPSYLRQPISFDLLRLSGSPSSQAFPVQLRLNGAYDRVGFHIEQVNDDFLKRQGLPEGGALYKFVQRANLRPVLNDIDTGVEKKTRESEDFSDLTALIAGLKQSQAGINIEESGSLIHTAPETAARNSFLFDHLNVPQVVNYLAAQIIIQDTDDTRKNFYLYRDTLGSGEWSIFPWDKDFTFGVGESAAGPAKHPFWGDAQHKNPNSSQWSVLFDAVHNNPRMRAMILRRTRSLMDQFYTPSPSNPGAWFEPEAQRLENLIDPVLNVDRTALVAEFNERRQDLYVNLFGPSSPEPLIPLAQSAALSLGFTGLDYNPASNDQDQEYIRLTNPHAVALDVSGWQLSGGVTFVFPGGTVVPAGENLYVSPATGAFRSRTTAPTGGQGLLVTGPYTGGLSNFGETVELRDAGGALRDSTSYVGDPSDAQLYLRVSELHYHPPGDGLAEFIELYNQSATVTLDLNGVSFSEGIDFTFTGSAITTLAPGQRVLVVRNLAAFTAAYGSAAAARVAGVFANATALSNAGERVKLNDDSGSTVFDFTYSDLAPWPVAADGTGPSLRVVDLAASPESPANWTAGVTGGTPGFGEADPFDEWLALYPSLSSPADRLPTADPDKDGMDNWSEFAFGLDPDDGSSVNPITLGLNRATATFTYTRRDPALTGLAYKVWTSPDPDAWTEDHAVNEAVSELGGGKQSVVVTLSAVAPLVAPKLFVRVTAE